MDISGLHMMPFIYSLTFNLLLCPLGNYINDLRRHILLVALVTLDFFKAESWQEFTNYSQTVQQCIFI